MSRSLSLFRAIDLCFSEKGTFAIRSRSRLLKGETVFISYKQARRLAFTEISPGELGLKHGGTAGSELVGVQRGDGDLCCYDESKADRPILWSLVQDEAGYRLTIY